MSESRACSAITRSGTRCRNTALDSSDYCYAHSRERAEERRQHARAGGFARSRSPDELGKIKGEIRQVLGAVLKGNVERGTGAILLQGYNTLLRAIETERKLDRVRELEESVDELRGRLAELRRAQWGR